MSFSTAHRGLAAIAVLAAFGLVPPAQAADPAKAAVPAADKTFATKAAAGGMAEVELGKLAQQKAGNDQVKAFGARMDQDHSKANDELKQIASGKGLTLPSAPDAKAHQDMTKMQSLSAAEFDRSYMSHMVADHKKTIADFEKESKSGKDADLKAFATKTLPTLREHLQMAEKTNVAVRSGPAAASKAASR